MNDTNTNTVRGILIAPDLGTISAVTLPGSDIGDVSLSAILDTLKCEHIDIVRLTSGGEVIFIDDEGRLTYPHPRGYFQMLHPNTGDALGEPICGRGLILGTAANGYTVSTRFPLEMALGCMRILLDPPPESSVEPRVTVASW